MHVSARVDDTYTASGSLLAESEVLTNTALLGWLDAPAGGTLRTRSALTTVGVVIPSVTWTKSSSVTTAAAGAVVTYTLTGVNTSNAFAYDVSVADQIPLLLYHPAASPQVTSVTLGGTPLVDGVDYTWDNSTSNLSVLMSGGVVMGRGVPLVVTYRTTVASGVVSGATMHNSADITYSSRPGSVYERIRGNNAQATVTAVAPALVTSKTVIGDTTPQRGKRVTYRFTVSNVGSATAHSLVVSDTLPSGFDYATGSTNVTWPAGTSTADPAGAPGPVVTWSPGINLAPGQQLTVTYQATVTAGAPLGLATNDAAVTGVDGGGATIPASSTIPADTDADDRSQATVRVTDPKVAVTKALLGGHPNPVRPGDPVTFTINVANSGDTTLTTVPLVDTFDPTTLAFVSASAAPNSTVPSGTLTWSDITGAGSLAPGSSTTITVRFDALAKSPSSVDTATVSGAVDANGDTPPSANSNADIAIRTIGVAVNKVLASGSPAVPVGGSVSYHIGVRNTGDTTLATVPLADTFDSRLRFVSATPTETSVTTPTISWANVGPLAPGATTTVTVDFSVLATGSAITDTATVAGATDGTDTAPTAESTNAVLSGTAPHLTITKTPSVATAGAGDVVTYTVAITNNGDAPAFDVTWIDLIDLSMYTPLASPSFDSAFMDSTLLIDGVDYGQMFGMGPWSGLQLGPATPIPVGSTLTITYHAVVSGGVTQGYAMRNLQQAVYTSLPGVVTGEGEYGPIDASATVTALSPALVTAKSASDVHVQRGQAMTWTYTVRNVGGSAAHSVDITDTLPAGFDLVPGTTSISWPSGSSSTEPTVTGQELAWSTGATLAPGQTLTLSFDTSVTAGAPLGLSANVASATALDGAASPVPADASGWIPGDTDIDDADTATVRVTDPKLSVLKTTVLGQDHFVQVGEGVSFDIGVTNTGDTTLTTVPLTDAYDAARLTFASAIPSEDTSGAGTLHWNDITGPGSLAPGATTTVTVSFTAKATGSAADTATASGTDINGDSAVPDSDSAGVRVTHPRQSITKTLQGPASVPVGSLVTYDIVVTNSGDTTLVAPHGLADTYDAAHLSFDSAVPAVDTTAPAQIAWNDLYGGAPLAPGAAATLSATFRVTAPGASIVDTAVVAAASDVNSDVAPSATATNAVLTATRPQLTIAKAASVTTAAAGDVITYTVSIPNTGTSAAWNVVWRDIVSLNLVDGATTPAFVGADIDGTPLAPAAYTQVFGTGTISTFAFAPATSLPSGSTLHIVYTARAQGGVHAGDALGNRATVESYASLPSNTTTYGPISDATTVTAVSPAFVTNKQRVSKSTAQRGDTVTWRYTVTNVGNGPSGAGSILDILPAGFDYVAGSSATSVGPIADPAGGTGPNLTWPLAALAASGSVSITFDSVATSAAPLGVATNNASAGALDGGGSVIPVDASPWIPGDTDDNDASSASVTLTNPHVRVVKAPHAGQDLFVQVGQPVGFDIVVTNDGDTVLPSVPLTDTFDSSRLAYAGATPAATTVATPVVGWANVGPLNPGQSRTVFATFTARAPIGTAADTATVAPVTDVNGDPVPPSTDTTSVTITRPQVSITKTLLGPATVALGTPVSYQVVVRNLGDTQLTTVPVSDTYAANLQFSSATPSEDASGAGTLSWNNVGPIAPGAAETVTVTFDTTSTGANIANSVLTTGVVDVHGDPVPSDTSTATLTVTAPFLSISKFRNVPTASAADEITYTVVIRNTGTSAAYNVNWQDVIHPQLTSPGTSPSLVNASIDGTPLVAGVDFLNSFGAGTTSWLSFAPATSLGVGSTLAITYKARVVGGVHSGEALTNTSTVVGYRALPLGNPILGPVSAAATVTALSPAFVTSKQRLSNPTAQRGDQVTWRVSVTNVGDAWANSITLTDTLPAGFTYVPGSSATSFGPLPDPSAGPGSTIGWSAFASLPPGGSTSVTFKSLVTSIAPLGVATNQGLYTGVDAAGTPVPADASGWIPADTDADDISQAAVLITNPRLTLSKQLASGQSSTVKPGGPVIFDLVVTNIGDTTATVIPIDDTFDSSRLAFQHALPSEDSSTAASLHWNDVATLAPGAVATVTVHFAAAVGNPGAASNVATITGATDEYGDPIPVVDSSATVQVARPEVTVRKLLAVGQSATVPIGGTVDYDLAVTNSGDTTLAAVPLADTFDSAYLALLGATPSPSATGAANIAWADLAPHFGQIAPGQTVTATVSFSTIATGTSIPDTASVNGATDIYGGSALPTESVNSVLTVTAPHLTIAKAASVTTAAAGDAIDYTVSIANDGNSAAWGLAWHDVIDSALASAGVSPAFTGADIGGTPLLPIEYSAGFGSGTTSTFDFAPTTSLPSGQTLHITYRAWANGGVHSGQLMPNTATVDSYTSLQGGGVTYGPVSATTTVTAVSPALVVGKVVNDTHPQRGQVITYTISVQNVGDGPATNLSVDDTLPADFSYVAGSSVGDGSLPLADPSISGQNLAWNLGTSLVPGQTTTISFRAMVASSAAIGNATNTAHAAGTDSAGTPIPTDASGWIPGDTDADDTAQVVVRVTAPQLSITKAPMPGQDRFVQAGQTVEFWVFVTNTGDTTLSTIPFTEVYDGSRLFLNSIAVLGPFPTGFGAGPQTFYAANVGPLAPGAFTRYRFRFTATAVTGSAADTASASATDTSAIRCRRRPPARTSRSPRRALRSPRRCTPVRLLPCRLAGS